MEETELDSRVLPERAFPMRNPELERTKVFWHRKGEAFPTLLTGFRDPGSTGVHLPVIKRLLDEMNICIFTDSNGQRLLEQSGLGFEAQDVGDSAILAISQAVDLADVILTGVSTDPGIETALLANARWDKLNNPGQRPTVIGIEDYPGALAWNLYSQRQIPGWVQPDYLCVANAWAKQNELKHLPEGLSEDKIIVTGQPSLDRLTQEDVAKVRKQIRKKLNISDDQTLIVYMGTDIAGETNQTLEFLIEVLERTAPSNYRLALRTHPKDPTTSETYDHTFESVKEKRVVTLDLTTDQVGMVADLVITNGSSTGMDAIYRGIPSVNVMISDPPKTYEDTLKSFPMPMTEDGAIPLAVTPQDLQKILSKIFSDPPRVSELRKKMANWKVDGYASERVANFVLEIAKEHRSKRG